MASITPSTAILFLSFVTGEVKENCLGLFSETGFKDGRLQGNRGRLLQAEPLWHLIEH